MCYKLLTDTGPNLATLMRKREVNWELAPQIDVCRGYECTSSLSYSWCWSKLAAPPPTHCGPSGTLINFDPPPIQQRSHLGFICINRKNNFNRTKTLRLQVQKKPRHCDIIYIQAITAPLCLRARAEGRRRQPSQRQIPVLKS